MSGFYALVRPGNDSRSAKAIFRKVARSTTRRGICIILGYHLSHRVIDEDGCALARPVNLLHSATVAIVLIVSASCRCAPVIPNLLVFSVVVEGVSWTRVCRILDDVAGSV